jgi:hypothetical protein
MASKLACYGIWNTLPKTKNLALAKVLVFPAVGYLNN